MRHMGCHGHVWKPGQQNQILQVHRVTEMIRASYWVVQHETLMLFSEVDCVASHSFRAQDEELERVRI